MIVDLSYPRGASINYEIPKEYGFAQYSSLQDAINLIVKCGPKAFNV